MLRTKKNVVGLLEIGTTKLVCLIVRIDDGDKVHIMGHGYKVLEGVKNGVVTDIKAASNAMSATIREAESAAGFELQSLYVVISDTNIKSNAAVDTLSLDIKNAISHKDLSILLDKTYARFVDDEVQSLMHVVPVEYSLDDNHGITNPMGMYGKRLSVTTNAITGYRPSLLNIANCLSRCHLSIESYVAAMYGAGFACIDSETNESCLVLDIGGHNTTVGWFKGARLVHMEHIPLGGYHITKDIAYAFSINIRQAEYIKDFYGSIENSSFADQRLLDLSNLGIMDGGSCSSVTVRRSALCAVIACRVSELLEIAANKLKERMAKDNTHITSIDRVVAIGGTSRLPGIADYVKSHFLINTRVGKVVNPRIAVSQELGADPSFIASIGTALMIADHTQKKHSEKSGKVHSWIRRIKDSLVD